MKVTLKRTLLMALLVLMVAALTVCGFVSTLAAGALSDADNAAIANGSVARIGDTYYSTLDEAISAANATTGDVTVYVLAKCNYTDASPSLASTPTSINFVGLTNDAEISITRNGQNGYISGTGSAPAVSFSDLILSKPTGSYAGDAGFMNVYFSVYRVASVDYTNCVFPDGACAQGCPVTYTDCEFANDASGEYSLWVYANTEVTVSGGSFTGVRGVKMYTEGNAVEDRSALTLTDVTFTDSVTEKPAVVLTYGASVELNDNTYNGVYSKTGTVVTFELDADGAPNGTAISSDEPVACVTEVIVEGNTQMVSCGVLVTDSVGNSVVYTTPAAAIADDAIATGDTVTLLADTADAVELPDGVILDTNGFEADSIDVKAVAKWGNISYPTLQAAIDAAEAANTAEIVIDLLDNATLDITAWQTLAIGSDATTSITINGNSKTLTFNKKNSDWNHIATAKDSTVPLTLKNVTLTDSGYNDGPWNRYDIVFACPVTLENVTALKPLAFKKDATLKTVNVTLDDSKDVYAI